MLGAPNLLIDQPGPLEVWWNTIALHWVILANAVPGVLLLAYLVFEVIALLKVGSRALVVGLLGRLLWAGGVVGFFVVTRAGQPSLEVALGLAFLVVTFGVWRGMWTAADRVWGARVPGTVVTLHALIYFLIFAYVSTLLPDGRSYFVLWHQLIRVGAALAGTCFVVGFMFLAMPWVLDRLEGSSFTQFVAARHVRASKSRFLTAISFLSIAGVALSAFALCIVISVMTGFGEDLKRKILGNNAHVKVEATEVGGIEHWRSSLDDVRTARGVFAATPVAAGEAMASSRTNTAGVLVRGIDPESIGQVIDLGDNIELGEFALMTDPHRLANLPPEYVIWQTPGGQKYLKGRRSRRTVPKNVADAIKRDDEYPGVILGRELAKTLHVYVGEELTLLSPRGELGPTGILPKVRRFRVAAIFYSGMYEYDASFAYMPLDEAQEFLDLPGRITAIDVKLEKAETAEMVRTKIESSLGREDVRVRDWKGMNRQLFSALELEKLATFIILSIAILVASFCIVCTLLLMVTEKSKEIAILKALGASDRAILWVFMFEGVIIGAIGTVLGVVTGLATTLGLKYFGVRLDPDVYYVDRLPINVDPTDYLLVALCAMIITTLATIYPALAASGLRPVEGIRYE